jgi:hypothetical protein
VTDNARGNVDRKPGTEKQKGEGPAAQSHSVHLRYGAEVAGEQGARQR